MRGYRYHISNLTVVLSSSVTVCVKNAAEVYRGSSAMAQHKSCLSPTSDGTFPVIIKLIFDESEDQAGDGGVLGCESVADECEKVGSTSTCRQQTLLRFWY